MSYLAKASTIFQTVFHEHLSTFDKLRRNASSSVLRRVCEIILTLALVGLLILGLTGNISSPSEFELVSSVNPATQAVDVGPAWPEDGWEGIRNIFTFGDSYSDTSFDPNGAQPNEANPFGNPARTLTLSSDSTWLHFLSTSYNAPLYRTSSGPSSSDLSSSDVTAENSTNLRIYNHAISGSTISSSLVPPRPHQRYATSTSQIHSTFLPTYASSSSHAPWSRQDTLFTLWFGINDITISIRQLTYPPIPALLACYAAHWETLYMIGARNFLILDIPPIYRAHSDASHAIYEAAAVWNFNLQLKDAVRDFRRRFPSVKMFLFLTHALWEEMLEAPGEFPGTREISMLEGPCEAYATRKGSLPADFEDLERCGTGLRNYFWKDHLHATFAVHKVTAEMVVRDCFGDDGPLGYCSA